MKITLFLTSIFFCAAVSTFSHAQTTKAGAAAPATVAADSRRVALVVGNSRYTRLSKLENSQNDADDIAKTLKKVGFEVIHVKDSDREGFFAAMQRFKQSIKPGGVSLFYYAGHGIQSNGVNYLMPVDAAADDEIAVRSKGVPLDEVLGLMNEARSALKIVYLDACREDPPQLKRATRSAARGLAEVPKAQGTIIEFSTSPGNVALDGKQGERNSPYTAALLKNIEKPGLQIEQLGKLVRAEVMSATKGKQEPWTSSSITNDFFFVPPKEGQQQVIVTTIDRGPEPGAGGNGMSRKGDSSAADAAFWNAVKDSSDPEEVQAYLDRFPAGQFADFAKKRLQKINAAAPKSAKDFPLPNNLAERCTWDHLSKEHVAQVKLGMHINEVHGIFGCMGKQQSATAKTVAMEWKGHYFNERFKQWMPGGRNVIVYLDPAGTTVSDPYNSGDWKIFIDQTEMVRKLQEIGNRR